MSSVLHRENLSTQILPPKTKVRHVNNMIPDFEDSSGALMLLNQSSL